MDINQQLDSMITTLQQFQMQNCCKKENVEALCHINSLVSKLINTTHNKHIPNPQKIYVDKATTKKKRKKKRRRATPTTLQNENIIVVYGLHSNDAEWYKEKYNITNHFLKDILKVSVTPLNTFTMGKKDQENKPIGITLKNKFEKFAVFKNCHNLKDTNIRVMDYLNREEKRQRISQYELLKQEKSKGNQVRFKGTQLFVNGLPVKASDCNSSACSSTVGDSSKMNNQPSEPETLPELVAQCNILTSSIPPPIPPRRKFTSHNNSDDSTSIQSMKSNSSKNSLLSRFMSFRQTLPTKFRPKA